MCAKYSTCINGGGGRYRNIYTTKKSKCGVLEGVQVNELTFYTCISILTKSAKKKTKSTNIYAINYITCSFNHHIYTLKRKAAILHIHVPLHFYCFLHIDPILLHISLKKTTKCNIFTKLLPQMCQKTIMCFKCQMYTTYANYLMYINGKYANMHTNMNLLSSMM